VSSVASRSLGGASGEEKAGSCHDGGSLIPPVGKGGWAWGHCRGERPPPSGFRGAAMVRRGLRTGGGQPRRGLDPRSVKVATQRHWSPARTDFAIHPSASSVGATSQNIRYGPPWETTYEEYTLPARTRTTHS